MLMIKMNAKREQAGRNRGRLPSRDVVPIAANLIAGMMNTLEQHFIGAIELIMNLLVRIRIGAVPFVEMVGIVVRLVEAHALIMAEFYVGSD